MQLSEPHSTLFGPSQCNVKLRHKDQWRFKIYLLRYDMMVLFKNLLVSTARALARPYAGAVRIVKKVDVIIYLVLPAGNYVEEMK